MQHTLRRTLGTAVVAFTLVGCGSLTDPLLEASFEWGEVDDPSAIVDGVETTVLLGELFLLGHVQTPTRCYRLDYDFDSQGSDLILRVEATTSNTANCDQSIGGFRYILRIFNLKNRTYQLRVIHEIEGAQNREFTKSVTIG